MMRPLTNSNFVLDFFRHTNAKYYSKVTKYLQHLQLSVPDYRLQYQQMLHYFTTTGTLHKYGKFTLSGAMSSTLNTKKLQVDSGMHTPSRPLAVSSACACVFHCLPLSFFDLLLPFLVLSLPFRDQSLPFLRGSTH